MQLHAKVDKLQDRLSSWLKSKDTGNKELDEDSEESDVESHEESLEQSHRRAPRVWHPSPRSHPKACQSQSAVPMKWRQGAIEKERKVPIEVINRIPLFKTSKVWQDRLSTTAPNDEVHSLVQELPPFCTFNGLDALLGRLDADRPWTCGSKLARMLHLKWRSCLTCGAWRLS